MPYVYILQSLTNSRYYIGSTIHLQRRLKEHNNGVTTYTSITKPFKLVFSQEFETITLAKKMERKLKSFKSKVILERIIKDEVIKTKVG